MTTFDNASVSPDSVQLAMDFTPLVAPLYEKDATIDEKFAAWSAANPWVLPALERLIADWLDAGHTRASLKQMWEVLRYTYGTTTGDRFKCNNVFTSRAARALLTLHPEWSEFIETRELRAA